METQTMYIKHIYITSNNEIDSLGLQTKWISGNLNLVSDVTSLLLLLLLVLVLLPFMLSTHTMNAHLTTHVSHD